MICGNGVQTSNGEIGGYSRNLIDVGDLRERMEWQIRIRRQNASNDLGLSR